MAEPIKDRIIKFINEHHVFTLATSANNHPYCCTCFYVYLETENLFVFTSDKKTKHIQDLENQKNVAGAIALETSIIGKIRGIQFTGKISELKGSKLSKAHLSYLKKFPIAILKETTLWAIEPVFIKMTDNRLGFGKKLIWEKSN
jgi:uncharacterized protein YhbP (UPF0306 family)